MKLGWNIVSIRVSYFTFWYTCTTMRVNETGESVYFIPFYYYFDSYDLVNESMSPCKVQCKLCYECIIEMNFIYVDFMDV